MPHVDVDRWMGHYDNPMRDVVQRLRHILLASDDRVEECIKWETPTFTYRGNIASFYPKSARHATLMFHEGAHIPGTFPHLEGAGTDGRAMRIVSIAEAEERRDEINRIIQAWIAWKDGA